MGSGYIAEKSLSQVENSTESCLINMLRNDLSGKVVIDDSSTMNHMNDVQRLPAEGHDIEKYQDDEEDEDYDEDGDDFSDEELLAQMGYGKSEPNRVIKKERRKHYSDDDEEDEEDDDLLEESLLTQMVYLKKEQPKHEPISTPTAALNLVSALKGNREIEGKQARECRVSWAPDVYDPPSSTENFAATDTQRHKSEHKAKGLAGKNKQKMDGKGVGGPEYGGGGGSKGSKVGGNKRTAGGGKAEVKYKDRKQVKKRHGGSASKYSNLDDS